MNLLNSSLDIVDSHFLLPQPSPFGANIPLLINDMIVQKHDAH